MPYQRRLLAIFALLWLLAVATRTAKLLGELGPRLALRFAAMPEQPRQAATVGVLVGGVVLLALILRILAPQRWSLVAGVVAVLAVIATATTGWAARDLFWVVLLTLASWQVGRWLVGALAPAGAAGLDRALLEVGIGWGGVSLLGLALGSVGRLGGLPLLLPLWLLAAIAVGAIARKLVRGRGDRGGRRGAEAAVDGTAVSPAPSWAEVALLGATASLLMLALVMTLAPEVQSDAVRVHLEIADLARHEGAIRGWPQQPVSQWPIPVQTLYAICLIGASPVAAKLLHWLAGLLLVAAVARLAGLVGGRRAVALGAALTGTMPLVLWEMGTAYVDLFAAFFAALALICLMHWQRTGDGRWAAACGLALGLGVASKLTMAFAAAGTMAALVAVGRAGNRWRERVAAAAWLAAGAALALAPWLLRSLVLTGSIPGLSLGVTALTRARGAAPPALANLPDFGFGRHPWSLLKLPWDLTFHSGHFGENVDGFLGFGLLALLPFGAAVRGRHGAALAVSFVTALLLWFGTAQYLRYLLPCLPALMALAAAGWTGSGWLAGNARTRPSGLRPWADAALTLALLASLLPILFNWFLYPGTVPLRLLLRQETRDQYLHRRVPSYGVLRRVNATLPHDARVVFLPEGPSLYARPQLLPAWSYPWLLGSRSAEELVTGFRRHGLEHLVLDRNAIPSNWRDPVVLRPDFLSQYARPQFAAGNVYWYRIETEPRAAPPGRELLTNPGFETLTEGTPVGWAAIGSPQVDATGGRAHSGRVAVSAQTTSSYIQTVEVEAGKSYVLWHFSRCEAGGSSRLQINWLDSAGGMLGPSLEVRSGATNAYARNDMWAQAPPGAVYANVYVSTHEEARCWFDDFHLEEAR